jgi:hypothetical protein
MGYARLRIDKYLEGERLLGGAIVDIRRFDPAGNASIRVARATVPMGQKDVANTVQLDPGTYEFIATLPSGQVLSRVVDVDASADVVPVDFDFGHSPREWLSWQHALGNVLAGRDLELMRATGAKVNWSLVDDVEAWWLLVPRLATGGDIVAGALAAQLALPPGQARVQFAAGTAPRQLNALEEKPFKVFQIPASARFDYESSQFQRSYALVGDTANRQMLCALPHPWRRVDGGAAIVEFSVGPDQPLDADEAIARPDVPWAVSTIARDDRVASVLSYFAAGDETAASFLASTALDLLFGKMINPFAATAGAYVLVDAWLRERGRQPQVANWLNWIDNLAKWFAWLPDGEILRGTVALADDASKARAAFVEAERRGLPVYTAGVQRLADGLTRIANQDKADGREDRAVIDALQRVRRLAWGVDPRYPFTTVRLWFDAG